MTLLDPKIEKSFTARKLKKFHPHPQLDIKFWNPYFCTQYPLTFGSKYLKTHVHRVISKIVFPKPQLDIKFWNP